MDGVSRVGKARSGQRCGLGMKGLEDVRVSRGIRVGRRMKGQKKVNYVGKRKRGGPTFS